MCVEAPPCAIPCGEDHRDPVGAEPTGAEQQRTGRRRVQPVRVVDDAEHRVLLGRSGEQRQRRHSHQERFDRTPRLLTEHDPQGSRLGFRQSGVQPGQRAQQAVQRREHQRRLHRHTLGAQHGGVAGTRHELLEQRGLADTGLAADDQRPRQPASRPLDERSQELPLRLATDQHATKVHAPPRGRPRPNPAL